jgi:DNA-binding CsgD family transcriptional regulator
VAVAIAAALLTYEMMQSYETRFPKYYFYYVVTFYGFALYGILAQKVMQTFLQALELDNGIIPSITTLLPLISIPFLLLACIMLVYMSYSLSGHRLPAKFELGFHFLVLSLAITALWGFYVYLFKGSVSLYVTHRWLTVDGILLLDGLYVTLFVWKSFWHASKGSSARKHPIYVFAALMALGCIIRGSVIGFMKAEGWEGSFLVILYFLSNIIPLFYLRMKSDRLFPPVFAGSPSADKKDRLCDTYKITRRERDIIDKICEGKTNQQIADELFISLQTVKDHTHRIYTKIGINSRLKLVQLVNGPT